MTPSSDAAEIQPRPVLGSLPPYAAGRPPQAVEGLQQFKLSSNENPWGPVPAVRAVIENYRDTHRYPDTLSTGLRERLGEALGIDPQDVVTGAGSLGALTQIINTFAGQNADGTQDEVLYAWRSFEAYPIVVALGGARSVQVPNRPDGRHDLEAMLAAVTERTRVILLCTPNNPTGPALTDREVREFMARVPQNVLVVLDEAYHEFCSASEQTAEEQAQGGIARGLELYPDFQNLVLLRTFSKAQALAGLRVGYSVSHPAVTRYLRTAATPFAVNSLAHDAAVAALEHNDEVLEQVEKIVAERERVVTGLREQGWYVPVTRANFFWLPLGEHSEEFGRLAEDNALSVRAFHPEGVRVSIGEEEANSRLLQLAAQFPHRTQPPADHE